MNNSLTTILILGLFCLCGGVAVAQDSSHTYRGPNGDLIVTWGPAPALPDQGRPDFDVLDRNGDGRLSLAEVESHRLLHSDFIYADGNRDGSISRTELARWN
jgi:hypothetical protein